MVTTTSQVTSGIIEERFMRVGISFLWAMVIVIFLVPNIFTRSEVTRDESKKYRNYLFVWGIPTAYTPTSISEYGNPYWFGFGSTFLLFAPELLILVVLWRLHTTLYSRGDLLTAKDRVAPQVNNILFLSFIQLMLLYYYYWAIYTNVPSNQQATEQDVSTSFLPLGSILLLLLSLAYRVLFLDRLPSLSDE